MGKDCLDGKKIWVIEEEEANVVESIMRRRVTGGFE